MNQDKIGKFIASARKKQKLTQEQLAEKLNITSKAVSKWECGKSLPDASIMLDLCNILKIDVNELLMGKKLNKDGYYIAIEKNKKINSKKKIIKYSLVFILIIIIAFIFFNNVNFLNRGITKDAKVTITNNDTHSSKDINIVIKNLKREFKSFKNCRLLTIDYDSKNQIDKYDDNNYVNEYDENYDSMVLNFSFKVEGENESLAIDETYNYTAYYVKETANSNWSLINWGQG